ncbi:MAG: IS4 family transposase [Planctomycetota bacterium]
MCIQSLDAPLWAAVLAHRCDLGDVRLNRRFARILDAVADHAADSIPATCVDWAATKATYRFLGNSRVTPEALIASQAQATVDAAAGLPRVLLVQDTTTLSFTTHPKTRGLGRIGPRKLEGVQGLFTHSLLALTDEGLPLGLLHQVTYARAEGIERAALRQHLPFEEKESVRWRDALRAGQATMERLPATQRPALIDIADRECDIHELLAEPRGEHDDFVIRCNHNRAVQGGGYAHEAVAQAACLGTATVAVPRSDARPARVAQVEYRAVQVHLDPRDTAQKGRREPLTATLVEVREVTPPAEVTEPLLWRLWTRQTVPTLERAQEIARLYSLRWRIEDFHLALKTGCGVEKLQLETADRLARAVAIYSAVAVRVVALRDMARREPEASCTRILTRDQWRVLYMHIHKKQSQPPNEAPTIQQAVLWIGRLGGHLNRKGDGMPGVKTLWLGLTRLDGMMDGYYAARRM